MLTVRKEEQSRFFAPYIPDERTQKAALHEDHVLDVRRVGHLLIRQQSFLLQMERMTLDSRAHDEKYINQLCSSSISSICPPFVPQKPR
jgi:hypothetical protein